MMEVSLTNTNQLVESARGVSRGHVWGVFEGVSGLYLMVAMSGSYISVSVHVQSV